MCMTVLPARRSVDRAFWVPSLRAQKRALGALALELRTAVNCRTGSRNQTQVL